jgi:hypothetical protein
MANGEGNIIFKGNSVSFGDEEEKSHRLLWHFAKRGYNVKRGTYGHPFWKKPGNS